MVRIAAFLSLLALPAFAEPPRVIADIAPIHSLVAQVMQGVAEPGLLLMQDADPHSVQLRPSQARMLAEADLVVWVGPALSPWMERALAGLGTGDQIVLMALPASHLRPFADHDAEAHDTADDDHDDHDDHDHGDVDPHVWLSVDNARAWLSVFAEDLAARDPENAATYRANAAKAGAGLAALEARIDARLAPHQGTGIVTFHDAFGYFADRFGIEIVGTVRPGDAATPSAAAMAELKALVAEHNVTCAFAEPAFDPALLQAIASDTGLRIGTLDPTGTLQVPGPDHYAATLDAIAESIASCLEAE